MKPTPAQMRDLRRADPALAAAMVGLPPFPGFPDQGRRRMGRYGLLARTIVSQQLATRAAQTIHARVCALTPGPRFPGAAELSALGDRELRAAGLSAPKIAALRDLAARVQDGRLALRGLARRTDDEVVEALTQVRGIGVWSAQMFLMFGLGRLDVLAPGDLGVQEGVRILDALRARPGPAAVERRAERWRPLRSVACWYMWRVVERARAR